MIIELSSSERNIFIDITRKVKEAVLKSGIQTGHALLFCPHTTAGLTINEAYDPHVLVDICAHLNKLVPPSANVYHAEGNSDAHIKASLMGASCTIPIENGRLILGQWQGIYFCEFDGPRRRQIHLYIRGD